MCRASSGLSTVRKHDCKPAVWHLHFTAGLNIHKLQQCSYIYRVCLTIALLEYSSMVMGHHASNHDPRDPSKKWPIWPIDPWPIDPLPALVTNMVPLILNQSCTGVYESWLLSWLWQKQRQTKRRAIVMMRQSAIQRIGTNATQPGT